MLRSLRLRTLGLLLPWIAGAWVARAADKPAGLQMTVSAGGATDLEVRPNAQLHVAAGEPATPFVPAGAFAATFAGFVSSELRAEYSFEAEANGEVRLEVNGTEVFSGKADGSKPLSGAAVKLNKGANAIKVEFKAPASGDAFLRLYWSNKETPRNPIPVALLTHDDAPALRESLAVHEGRDLFLEGRCIRCHAAKATVPEAAMDAPAFAGIGSRRNEAWLARWIEDPASMRPGTPMPRLFAGPDAKANAAAVAAYLASLKSAPPAAATGDKDAGKALYEKLLCASCHNPPDAAQADASKISQKGVKAKFAPGALAAFLRKPSEHFAWIRMPDFRLSAGEAGHLAAYLEASADAPSDAPAAADAAVVAKGRALVESAGCVACHALDGAKAAPAKALGELPADRWTAGCMADAPADGSKAPRYAFAPAQREALRAWAKTDRASLGRQTAADFLARQSAHLQCAECHGKHEGFPAWELLAGKLKPEWAARFIGGQEPWKPRTWLEARMPAFPAHAAGLAQGLATRHGLPAATPADAAPAGAADDAEKGRKLVSANGGFSCISCHAVGDFAATAVFEAPGINLSHSFERIQPDYFRRWLRSPMSVDPTTKMPVYFDEEGKSPLSEFYGGDGPKTLGAIWEYLRLGPKMAKPE